MILIEEKVERNRLPKSKTYVITVVYQQIFMPIQSTLEMSFETLRLSFFDSGILLNAIVFSPLKYSVRSFHKNCRQCFSYAPFNLYTEYIGRHFQFLNLFF